MQEKYLSLDPRYVAKYQSFHDRRVVFNRRYTEARGGPYAQHVGTITGLTVSTLLYNRA